MSDAKMKLGLLLPNQGVVFGATTVDELISLAETADASGAFDAVFVGDNLLAKPRLESVTTLSALAARTKTVKLGTACMASFPLRDPIVLAAQWSALDNLSGGRALLVACMGGAAKKAGDGTGGQSTGTGAGGAPAKGAGNTGPAIMGRFQSEYEAFRIPPSERAARMEEGIQVLRVLWANDPASFQGRFYAFENIAVRPQPVQQPLPPIWIANNPHIFDAGKGTINRALERVAALADGWMTLQATPMQFRATWAAIRNQAAQFGRRPDKLESSLYYNIHVSDDTEAAFAETKRFLDEYYSADYTREQIDRWSAYGPAEVCAEGIRQYAGAGVGTLCIRLTAYDQTAQLKRLIEEVLPLVS